MLGYQINLLLEVAIYNLQFGSDAFLLLDWAELGLQLPTCFCLWSGLQLKAK